MTKKTDFSENGYILAGNAWISPDGPTAATMAAVTICAHAPAGAIYHSFTSRTDLSGSTLPSCKTNFGLLE